MNPRFRNTLTTVLCAALAIWLGRLIADGSFLFPAMAAVVALAAILTHLTNLRIDVIFTGFLLAGYFIGNRGFAQLMPVPGLPLLPAEGILMLAGGTCVVAAAINRRLPFVRDALNWAVLAWLVVGSARALFDVPRSGILAVRDFAMVYYAAFFFLAQEMSRTEAARKYLVACVVFGCLAITAIYPLYQAFPMVFVTQLVVHGVPVIYFKGDLVYTYLAVGSVLLFHIAKGRWLVPGRMIAVGMGVAVMGGPSRASQVGLVAATLLLLAARRFRYPVWQGALGAAALCTVLGLAIVANNTWAERKLNGMADRARSMIDVHGVRSYDSEESFFKGDNNRFRLIWWKNVIEETWSRNWVFGMGFGADLAAGFTQEYYPEALEEFTARSPHNIFITTWGRMGAAGLACWMVVCTVVVTRTWRRLRESDDPTEWALWCSVVIILCSATFGVVLEGPMGAVPFWVFLGIANSFLATERTSSGATSDRDPTAPLPADPARV